MKEAGANTTIKTKGLTPLELAKSFLPHTVDAEDKTKLEKIIKILSSGPKDKL